MRIDVRDAVREDADDIASAHVAAWRVAYAHIFPQSIFDDPDFDASRRQRWATWTHSPTPDRRLVVGTVDGTVMGWAHTGDAEEAGVEAGELLGFYLHPDAWGTGVATAMMTEALAHLRSLGWDRAVLWTLEPAHRARSFYEKSGWALTGRTDIWTHYPDHPIGECEYGIDL